MEKVKSQAQFTDQIQQDRRRNNQVITRRPNGTIRVTQMFPEETLTQQQFAEETNVNKIMAKYKKTRMITHINSSTGVYADLTKLDSFQTAQETVLKATNAFMDLPSEVRNHFNNDPGQLIEFLKDKNNKEEAIKLGLIVENKINPLEKSINDLNDTIKNERKTKSKSDDDK